MDKKTEKELYADVMQTLIEHLQKRNDVQNIDLMNLSGFCRNCLSKWYVSAAEKRNLNVNYEEAGPKVAKILAFLLRFIEFIVYNSKKSIM